MKNNQSPTNHGTIRFRILMCISAFIIVWWFNNFTLNVNNVSFTDSRINDVISIVQITDLHGAKFGRNNKRLIKKIEKQNPDLIFVTGDMYSNIIRNSGMKTALELMQYLGKRYTVYYINGEHDRENSEFCNAASDAGVRILNYRDEIITVKNTTLHLYGINNVYYSDTFDLKNAFMPDEENYSVLLAHTSNFRKFADFGIDLSVCGDTHGGMYRLPFIGALYDGSTYLPDKQGLYMKGTYSIGESKLFISSGLGNYPFPLRFCNRPEIVNISLAPSK